jgi:hypothetical protein
MMTIIAAAALAAQPAAPAPAAQHDMHTQRGQAADHKDCCCKECCKDMEGKMKGHHAEHGE